MVQVEVGQVALALFTGGQDSLGGTEDSLGGTAALEPLLRQEGRSHSALHSFLI